MKEKFWALQDKWDEFKEDPRKTHLAAAFAGAVVATILLAILK